MYEIRDSDVLAWVREQRKISQVLGVFRPLDFTMLQPVLTGARFVTYELYFCNFQFFEGHGKPWILNQWMWQHSCTLFNPVTSDRCPSAKYPLTRLIFQKIFTIYLFLLSLQIFVAD
jgi:hypothetical protein